MVSEWSCCVGDGEMVLSESRTLVPCALGQSPDLVPNSAEPTLLSTSRHLGSFSHVQASQLLLYQQARPRAATLLAWVASHRPDTHGARYLAPSQVLITYGLHQRSESHRA